MIFTRRMLRDDCLWCEGIEARIFRRGYSRHWFKDAVADDGILKYVAQIGDVLAGYLVCTATPGMATIEALAVEPISRRKLVGSALLVRLSADLARGGATWPENRSGLQVGVCELQLAGQLFLKASGFRAGPIYRESCTCGHDKPHDLIEFARPGCSCANTTPSKLEIILDDPGACEGK